MLIAGHQPNYLPYCGFFHKAALSDVFVIVDAVQFVKGGPFAWQHRNKIRTKDGWIWLTVPVLTKGKYHQNINEVKINNIFDWRRKHWRSIYMNYRNAQYFEKYSDFFEFVYKKEWERLVDLNMEIISFLLKELGIEKRVIKCSELGATGGKTELLADICRRLNSNKYLSGVHGREYIDEEMIKENNLEVIFQDFEHPVYDQGYSDFIPNLSVIDLLFRNGKRSLDLIMESGERAKNYVG